MKIVPPFITNFDSPNRGRIRKWIAVHRDDVGLHSRSDRADLISQSQRLGRKRCGGDQRCHWVLSALLDSGNKLLAISSVCAGDCIGAIDDLKTTNLQSPLEPFKDNRFSLHHIGEPFFVIVADTQVLLLVRNVILKNEADIRIEVGSILHHQFEDIIRNEGAVFHRSAAGKTRCFCRRSCVRVNQCAQPQLLRLSASGLKLSIGHRLGAAFANALRGKDLDKVCPLLFPLPHQLAEFFRISTRLGKRLQRGQNSWTGNNASSDRITKILILG